MFCTSREKVVGQLTPDPVLSRSMHGMQYMYTLAFNNCRVAVCIKWMCRIDPPAASIQTLNTLPSALCDSSLELDTFRHRLNAYLIGTVMNRYIRRRCGVASVLGAVRDYRDLLS